MDNSAALTEVLNSFLWNRSISDDCFDAIMIDPGKFFEFAGIHNVHGIAAYKIYEYASLCPEDEELSAIAKVAEVYYNKTVDESDERAEQYRKLAELFCDNNIDFIPLKGILVREYYTVPQLRSFSDIDIIIRESDRQKCQKVMLDNGFEEEIYYRTVWNYKRNNEYYEIHTEIIPDDIKECLVWQSYFKTMWDNAEIYLKNEYRLKNEFHFVFLIAHIAKHMYCRGAGIRMYLDLAFIFKNTDCSIKWDVVLKELKKLKLDKFFYVVANSVKAWFGISLPFKTPNVETGVLDSFYEFTMKAGVFGKEGVSSEMAIMKQVEKENSRAIKIKSIAQILFPPKAQLESKYTYIKDKPYLIPAAWIHRIISNIRKVREKTSEIKEVVSMNDEDIRELNVLYKNIGL